MYFFSHFFFLFNSLTAAGYLCYLRSIHRIIDESHRIPWRDEVLKMSPQRLSIVVLLVFVTVVLLKAYAIGIVWRCYKYLTMRQHNIRSMLPYIIPEISTRQERDYNTLLPDYEEAIAQSMKQPPPPYYQVAMTNASIPITGATVALATTSIHTIVDDNNVNALNTPPAYNENVTTMNATSVTDTNLSTIPSDNSVTVDLPKNELNQSHAEQPSKPQDIANKPHYGFNK